MVTKNDVITEIKTTHKLLGRRPVKRDNNYLYFKTRKYFGTWNNAIKMAGYTIKSRQTPKIPRITPDLCYFSGLLITDGHMQIFKNKKDKSCKYSLRIYTSYPEEVNVIVSLIKHLFNYEPHIRKRKKYGWNKLISHEIIISSKPLVNFVNGQLGVPIGNKSLSAEVPNIFFFANKRNLHAFIRGLIDGDGSVTNQRMNISSGSRKFICDLIIIFQNRLGIQVGSTFKGRKNSVGYICVTRKEDLKKLYGYIYPTKFFYPRKKNSWDKLLKAKMI